MKVFNKQAPASYKLQEKFEAGIVLIGSEVKAVKLGHVDLTGSHVKIIGGEGYLVNAKIFPYPFSRVENYDERRSRKLLLHKKELLSLKSKLEEKNLTIVPISMYTTDSELIKIELAVASGKKQFDKRRDIKKRDLDREISRELKKFT